MKRLCKVPAAVSNEFRFVCLYSVDGPVACLGRNHILLVNFVGVTAVGLSYFFAGAKGAIGAGEGTGLRDRVACNGVQTQPFQSLVTVLGRKPSQVSGVVPPHGFM